MGTLQTLDWLAIGIYFSVLAGVAWWVVRKGKKKLQTTSLPDGISAGGSSARRSSHPISDRNISSALPARAQKTASRWRTTNSMPGACSSWHGSSSPSMRARWCSPCRSFLNGASRTRSRYVLSIVSIVTFIVSKIAVGIFAGGVVFSHPPAGNAVHDRRACWWTASGSAPCW